MSEQPAEEYILYVKRACPFCLKAENLLIENGLSDHIKIVPFDDQPDALEHMKWAYSHKTVPIIFHRTGDNIVFVGGYTDLVAYIGENNEPAKESAGS